MSALASRVAFEPAGTDRGVAATSRDSTVSNAHPSVLITGGGTAGHVEPALAIARALTRLGVANSEILFVGARRGMETNLVPEAGFALRLLPGRGLVRRVALANVVAGAQLCAALFEALWIVGRKRPSVVVMVGGYAGVACSLAALFFGIPVVVVNVDSTVGRANRLVGRFAVANAVSSATSGLPRAVLTGAPVRDAVLEVDRSESGRDRARAVLEVPSGPRVLAVVGGSLGAKTLNTLALQLRQALSAEQNLLIYHVCGARNEVDVRDQLAKAPLADARIDYRLVAYERHLPALFCVADLVITRAGAMTVAELAVIGVPAILVPLPGAPGDHQSENARALEAVGAAVVVRDDDATGERVGAIVTSLLANQARLVEMGAAARTVARPDAATAIAELVAKGMVRRGGESRGAR